MNLHVKLYKIMAVGSIVQWTRHDVFIHSQKELAHWAVDLTVEFYACLFSSSLMCDTKKSSNNVIF